MGGNAATPLPALNPAPPKQPSPRSAACRAIDPEPAQSIPSLSDKTNGGCNMPPACLPPALAIILIKITLHQMTKII